MNTKIKILSLVALCTGYVAIVACGGGGGGGDGNGNSGQGSFNCQNQPFVCKDGSMAVRSQDQVNSNGNGAIEAGRIVGGAVCQYVCADGTVTVNTNGMTGTATATTGTVK